MQDPNASSGAANGKPSAEAREAALRTRFERLRSLRSAWGVLAPSGLSAEKRAVADAGRALSEELLDLLSEPPCDGDREAISTLDARLDALDRDMRDVALRIPVAQLRATLPDRVAADRRGVLDLLDLVLGAEIAGQSGTEARIPTFDYLITLLCTGGDPDASLQDPITLTPRLHSLCMRSDVGYDERLPQLEAEFFAAADLHQADVREEVELRTLRRRKMELGSSFFAPRVLRALMTYNAALLRRIDEEVLSSQDWGVLPDPAAPDAEAGGSVFASPALAKLAAALRRRAAGDPPAHDPVDRIAWCLDLSSLQPAESRALLGEGADGAEELMRTTILVGLLGRSAVVLDEELPAIGIAPESLSGAWLQQLDEALQQEVNRRIADDYAAACVLADLKGKYLATTRSTEKRRNRAPLAAPRAPVEEGAGEDAARQARRIVEAALEPSAGSTAAWRGWPWRRVTRAAGTLLVAVSMLWLAQVLLSDARRVARADLRELSPFLASGKRSDAGAGSAFVGRLEDHWLALASAEQEETAHALVRALRDGGVREIMVYDGDDQLRIQALGNQPPRVLSPARVSE